MQNWIDDETEKDVLLRINGPDSISFVFIKEVVSRFPQLNEEVIARILSDKSLLKNYFQCDVAEFCEIFSTQKNKIIEKIFEDSSYFEAVLVDSGNVRRICEALPEYKNTILERVIQNSDWFKTVFVDHDNSVATCFYEDFPEHKNVIVEKILNDPEMLKKILYDPNAHNINSLLLSNLSLQNQQRIIEEIVNHEDLYSVFYNQLFFDEHDVRLLVIIVGDSLDSKYNFFERFLNDYENLRKMFFDRNDAIELIRKFPNRTERIMKMIFKDPVIFDYVFSDQERLDSLRPYCTQIPAIWNASTIDDVCNTLRQEAAREKMKIIFRYTSTKNLRFSQLPPDLTEQIIKDHWGPSIS